MRTIISLVVGYEEADSIRLLYAPLCRAARGSEDRGTLQCERIRDARWGSSCGIGCIYLDGSCDNGPHNPGMIEMPAALCEAVTSIA